MTDSLTHDAPLSALLRPRSVAIIGASEDTAKSGGSALDLMIRHGYGGALYPVNPGAAILQGLRCHASLTDIEDAIDLAICAVPADRVERVLHDCVEKRVRAAIVFASGFAETGPHGQKTQARLLSVARGGGMRLLGPNCLGAADFSSGMIASFHHAFRSPAARIGRFGLVSQSGAFCGLVYMLALRRGLSPRTVLTTGNEADIDVADGIAWMTGDPQIDVILLCLEGSRDGAKLAVALDLARKSGKVIVALKVGGTDPGKAAAQSHTDALAGEDAVYDAVFRQFGVVRVESLRDLVNMGIAASVLPIPVNDLVAMTSVSGGVGVLMADDAIAGGLDVAPFSDQTRATLKRLIPAAGVQNPLDLTAQVVGDPDRVQEALSVVFQEADYGAQIVFVGAAASDPTFAATLRALLRQQHDTHPHQAQIAVGLFETDTAQAIEADGLLVVEEPTDATRVLAALRRVARVQSGQRTQPDVAPTGTPLTPGRRTEIEALDWLRQSGIAVVPVALVRSANEAANEAARLGGFVAVKVVSRDIAHKTELGGVALGLDSPETAARAFETIMAAVSTRAPHAQLGGCLVAPMLAGGQEMIVGASFDPVFGPIVLVGLGGTNAEALNDVAIRLAPINGLEARAMIAELRGAAVLDGWRGEPPADIDALVDVLLRLSQLALAHRATPISVEINPLLVRPQGLGAVALDASLVVAPAASDPKSAGLDMPGPADDGRCA